MSTARGRVQTVLAAGLALVGLICAYGALLAAPEEAAGCQNATCKDIRYFIDCSTKTGGVFDLRSCVWCAEPFGRCANGNTNNCTVTSQPLRIAVCEAEEVCLCANNPSPNPFVEATGTYSGTYTDSGFARKVCTVFE